MKLLPLKRGECTVRLVEGTNVEVQGLKGAKQYNGMKGVIKPWGS